MTTKHKAVRIYDPKQRDIKRIRATRIRMKWCKINAIVFFLTAANAMILVIMSIAQMQAKWILIHTFICAFLINRALAEMTEFDNCRCQLMIDDLIDTDHPH